MKLNSIENFLRTIVATALTVVTISACEPVSNSGEEQADIISIVGAKVVQVDAAGGDVELSYKLSDAPEGAALTATGLSRLRKTLRKTPRLRHLRKPDPTPMQRM